MTSNFNDSSSHRLTFSPLLGGGNNGSTTLTLTPKNRKTTDHLVQDLGQEFREAIAQLHQLWDQVHMDADMRETRMQQAREFLHNLLNDIVTSEEQMVQNVSVDVDARRKVVAELRRFFKRPPFDESIFPVGSIALLKALDTEMTDLETQRSEIATKQMELAQKYKLYCKRLGILPESQQFGEAEDQLLSNDEVLALQAKVNTLKKAFTTRLDKALLLQSEAKKIFETIQLPNNHSISGDDLQCLQVDLHGQHLVLSQDLLNKLQAINQRLKDHHDVWIEQVAFRYDELLVRLDDISAKCFRPPASGDYPDPQNIDPARLTEKELQKLEQEVQAREELYARAQPVFDKLNEWMASWKEKLDTERRVCRASFYKNRAGSLNQKLKQRKLLDQKVPRLFNELQAQCEEYVTQYRVYDILVDGLRADKYAAKMQQDMEQDREIQKVQKQMSSSTKTAAQSRTPGPAASSSRSVFAKTTPAPFSSATRMLNMAPPATAGRTLRKRSFSCSQLSVIYPIPSSSRAKRGLLTSTPKPDYS